MFHLLSLTMNLLLLRGLRRKYEKKKAKKALRQIGQQENESKEDSAGVIEVKDVKEVRSLQKFRKRVKGIDSNKLQGVTIVDEDAARLSQLVEKGENEWGNFEASTPSTAVKVGVQDSFQKEVNQKDVLQAQMETYIEEELEKRRQAGPSTKVKEKKEEIKKISEEDQLYQTPDYLKQQSVLDEDEVSGERWLAGIAEVQLPITYKLKNIEETELAKQELFAKKGKRKEKEGPLPANYNADFIRHKKEWDKNRRDQTKAYWLAKKNKENPIKEKEQPEPPTPILHHDEYDATPSRPSGEIVTNTPAHLRGGEGRNTPRRTVRYATDDKVLDRFIKKFKWR